MWKDFPRALCDARRRARPRLLAPRLRPLDAARRATSAGTSTSCTARRTRCCRRCFDALGIEPRRPGCSATATAARSRCCTPRASRARRRRRSRWRRTSSSRTIVDREHRAGARRLLDDRPARAAGALPRRPRLGLLGLERHLAATRRSATGTSKREIAAHPLPGARGAGRRRRVRHAGADPRHRAPRAADARCSSCRLRPFAASRPARAVAERDRRVHRCEFRTGGPP